MTKEKWPPATILSFVSAISLVALPWVTIFMDIASGDKRIIVGMITSGVVMSLSAIAAAGTKAQQ